MNRPLALLALLASIAALAVAGCGGGDDSTSASTSAELTADEWVAQADQICAQGDKDQQAAIRQFFQDNGISTSQQPTAAQFQQLATEVVIPSIEEQINAVEALPVPEESADQVDAFVEQADADLEKLKSDPSQVIDEGAFDETEKLARELGLQNCASG
jgi:hypothetical protein